MVISKTMYCMTISHQYYVTISINYCQDYQMNITTKKGRLFCLFAYLFFSIQTAFALYFICHLINIPKSQITRTCSILFRTAGSTCRASYTFYPSLFFFNYICYRCSQCSCQNQYDYKINHYALPPF